MSVFSKMLTLLRSSVREIGDSVVNGNATPVYEQEIMDARAAVAKAKQELTLVMAKEMQAAREIERLRCEAARYEEHAVEALATDEALAHETAGRVAALEDELDEETRAHSAYALNVSKLKDLIKTAEAKLREHERELAMARTTESVYRATQTISHGIGASGSKLLNARESLERIKQRHTELADRMAAAELLDKEFGVNQLDAKLAAAGIGAKSDQRAQQVMERVRARRQGASASATGAAPVANP